MADSGSEESGALGVLGACLQGFLGSILGDFLKYLTKIRREHLLRPLDPPLILAIELMCRPTYVFKIFIDYNWASFKLWGAHLPDKIRITFNPFNPHDALKHHFSTVKNDLTSNTWKGFRTTIFI